jgi:catechol 2,3-dioxygenase-like lactoylglutathione lyase family enzyme
VARWTDARRQRPQQAGRRCTTTGASSWTPRTHALGQFYSDLLGWPIAKEDPGGVALLPPDGVAYLAIQTSDHYVRPVWPDDGRSQQMMVHLDFEVDDLEVAVAFAVASGAAVADHQPQEDVRVMLDPAGHPFCLYRGS